MVVILTGKAGGIMAAISQIPIKYSEHIPLDKQPSMIMLAALVFMTSFGTWGLPQMVQKFYAIKNEQVINKAAIVTTMFAIIIVFSAYFTGSMTHLFYDGSTLPMVTGADGISKVAFDRLIPNLLVSNLPEVLMALIILLVLSASMSTLSSLVLVSSSSVAIDMYKGHINPQITKENSVAMMRFLCVLFVIISYFIARYEFAFIVTLMSLSWGAIAGSFMAPYLYSLYWKRTTKAAIFTGMISGLVISIVLFFVLGPKNSPIASSLAMIIPFIIIPVVSLFTKAPDKELLDKAFAGIGK